MRTRLLLAATALLLSACTTVRGSGNLVSRTEENLPAFRGLEVSNGIEARVTPGPQSVRLSGDDNLVALLQLEVHDGILHLSFPERTSVWGDHDLRVEVTMPRVDYLAASGGAEIDAQATRTGELTIQATGGAEVEVRGVQADLVVVDASGGSEVTLSGRAHAMEAELSGATSLHARSLDLRTLAVDVSGASEVEANVQEEVRGEASGASSVHVRGRPYVANVDTSGASDFEIEGE